MEENTKKHKENVTCCNMHKLHKRYIVNEPSAKGYILYDAIDKKCA